MTAGKRTRSKGEAGSKMAVESNGAEERKPSTKGRKGKKAKGKLAVKSNGAEKLKTHDPFDVPRLLAVKSNVAQEVSDGLFIFKHDFHKDFLKKNPNDPNDKRSIDAVFKAAADRWESFSDPDKAPYVARGRVNRTIYNKALANRATFRKTMELADKMVELKM